MSVGYEQSKKKIQIQIELLNKNYSEKLEVKRARRKNAIKNGKCFYFILTVFKRFENFTILPKTINLKRIND